MLLHAFFNGGQQLVESFLEKFHAFVGKLIGHHASSKFLRAQGHPWCAARPRHLLPGSRARGRDRETRPELPAESYQPYQVRSVLRRRARRDTPDFSCWCWPTERAASVRRATPEPASAGRRKSAYRIDTPASHSQSPLCPCSGAQQSLPIGRELRILQQLRRYLLVDQRVNAADEETRHARHAADVSAALRKSLQVPRCMPRQLARTHPARRAASRSR